MIYLQLLLSYLKIGFFGFGGGYAMLSLIQNEIVVQRGWLTSEQLTDIIAISQVTPPYRHQQRHIRRICRDGYGLGCGPRYAGCLHPVAYPDACGHEVLSQAARQPLRVRRHGGNETDDDRNDNGRGAPAPHPRTFIDWKAGRYSPPPSSLRSKR